MSAMVSAPNGEVVGNEAAGYCFNSWTSLGSLDDSSDSSAWRTNARMLAPTVGGQPTSRSFSSSAED